METTLTAAAKKTTKKCMRCKGTGSILIDRRNGIVARCPACSGMGSK